MWGNIASLHTGATRQQAIAKARAAANTALALNPNSAPVHSALGTVRQALDHDWAGAEAEYRRAIQLDPSAPGSKINLANLLLLVGRPGQAVNLLHQSLTIDPLRPTSYIKLAFAFAMLGRLDDAERAIHQAIKLQPARAPLVHGQLTFLAILRGDAKAALAQARQTSAGGYRKAYVALALQIGSDRAAADAALNDEIDIQAGEAAYQIAEMYALRKDADNMFIWLDRALVNQDPGLESLLSDPLLKPYWHDPRFATFVRKLGLPAPGEKPSGAAAMPAS